MNTFGERLKKLRSERNKLQKEVAIDLKISNTGYSSYENDLRMPGVEMLIKIANYYNVTIDYLLGLDNRTFLDKNEIELRIKNLKDKFNSEINNIEEYINNTK